MEELDKASVEDLLKSGRFFGSNGPEEQFRIGNAVMGETYYVERDTTGKIREAEFHIEVFDPSGQIEEIIVYQGIVDGDSSGKANTRKVAEFFPVGETEKRFYTRNIYRTVKSGEFYRVEVVTSLGIVSYLADSSKIEKGFAYTNPVWIGEL